MDQSPVSTLEIICGHFVTQVGFLQVFQLLHTIKTTETILSAPRAHW